MTNEVMPVKDPLGQTIFILHGIALPNEQDNPEILDDAATVIRKPALLIETDMDGHRELHYFRSVGWHNTMLLTVHFFNGRWETIRCVNNPSSIELAHLLQSGKQLL